MKDRICKSCKSRFTPQRPLQGVCSPKCAYAYQRLLKEKKEAKEWKVEKKEMKENLKTHSDYLRVLQVSFNTYIRFRDKGKPCISCNNKIKDKYDAGHYFSVGGYPALRFNEDNVHAQCVSCNQWLHGNLIMYAENLPKRIGFERTEILFNTKNTIAKLSIPEIKDKIKEYKLKLKQLNDNILRRL